MKIRDVIKQNGQDPGSYTLKELKDIKNLFYKLDMASKKKNGAWVYMVCQELERKYNFDMNLKDHASDDMVVG